MPCRVLAFCGVQVEGGIRWVDTAALDKEWKTAFAVFMPRKISASSRFAELSEGCDGLVRTRSSEAFGNGKPEFLT